MTGQSSVPPALRKSLGLTPSVVSGGVVVSVMEPRYPANVVESCQEWPGLRGLGSADRKGFELPRDLVGPRLDLGPWALVARREEILHRRHEPHDALGQVRRRVVRVEPTREDDVATWPDDIGELADP